MQLLITTLTNTEPQFTFESRISYKVNSNDFQEKLINFINIKLIFINKFCHQLRNIIKGQNNYKTWSAPN